MTSGAPRTLRTVIAGQPSIRRDGGGGRDGVLLPTHTVFNPRRSGDPDPAFRTVSGPRPGKLANLRSLSRFLLSALRSLLMVAMAPPEL